LAAPPEHKLLTRAFVLAWFAHFFHCVATSAYVHLPGFLKDLGASELSIGSLFGATAAIAVVSRPLLGGFVDRVGRRAFILGAGAAHTMLCAAYLTIHDLSVAIYVLRALHGVVEAIIFWILFTYAAEIVPASRRTEGIAWFAVSAQIPIALGAVAGDAILAKASYQVLFGVTAVCAALGFLASLPLEDPDHAPVSVPSRGLVACATQRNLVPLWFVGVVFATAICPAFVFLKTYVMVRHVGSVGLFLAAYSLTAATFRVAFGWLPDRIGPKRVLGPAMFAVAGGLLLLAIASRAIEIGAAGVLAGAGHGLVFPILVGLVVDRARPAERAVAMSLATSVFDVGQLIGGPLFGSIIEGFGYSASYGTASVLAASGFVVFASWDRIVDAGREPG